MSSQRGSKPRVFFTGAAGVVTTHIVAALRDVYDLVLTDLCGRPDQSPPIQALDILDFDATLVAMRSCDVVVHMAIASERSQLHLPRREADDQIMQVNMIGTQHVFEAARQLGVRRVVFVSSMTIMLGQPALTAMDEYTPPRPSNLYACTKLFGEQLAEYYSRELGLSIVCLRLGQPFPVPPKFVFELLLVSPRARSVAVMFEDVAEAVRCAIEADVHHTVVQVVSESDQTAFPRLNAEKIGYKPRWRTGPDGHYRM